MEKLTISKSILGSLIPQRNLLNAVREDLIDQTFKLSSVAPDENNPEFYKEGDSEVKGAVRLRYINTKNSNMLTFPVRGLLFSNYTPVKDSSKFDEKTSEIAPVHKQLMEAYKTTEKVELPQEFTIVDVKDRVNARTKKVVYPSYAYEAFQTRVNALPAGASVLPIYQDRSFMMTLSDGKLDPQYEGKVEPVKDIVITLP